MTTHAPVLGTKRAPLAGQSRAPRPWPAVSATALLGTGILFLLRFGYEYGAGDQDEIIPFLLHRLDPSLLASDWFVDHQTSAFSVRLYVVLVLQALAQVMPAWAAVLLLHAASFALICWALFLLALELTSDRIAAALTIPVTLVATSHWTLGGNDLLSNQLTPTAMASAAALFGVVFLLRRRYAVAGLLLGVASCFQLLVGFHLALLSGVWLLSRLIAEEDKRDAVINLSRFGLAYAVSSAPALLPVLLQQQAAGAEPQAGTPSLFYILGTFRAPHHYLFHSFPATSYVKFGLLTFAGLSSLWYLRWRDGLRHKSFLALVLAVCAGLMFLGYLFTEAVPVCFVLKLQLFKLSVFAKVLFVIGISAAAVSALPGTWRAAAEGLAANSRPVLAASGLACLLAAGLILFIKPVQGRVNRWSSGTDELGRIEAWARDNTPKDVLFAVPPSVTSFRSRAQRAIVVNFKALPLVDSEMHVWMRRLLDVSPIALPERGGSTVLPALDAAIAGQSPEGYDRLAETYGADFIVTPEPAHRPSARMRVAYRAGSWTVYAIAPQGVTSASQAPSSATAEPRR